MRFIVTKELGRLAKWLRILGFDTIYFMEENRSSLIICALREDRIILTRNKRFPSSKGIKSLYIKSDLLREQISQVIEGLKLSLNADSMFCRCIICNEILNEIPKDKIKDRVPEYVFKTQEDFFTCSNCQRIYWQGTHWGNVKEIVRKLGEGYLSNLINFLI